MISVLAVINNETIAREFLLKGLSKQNSKFELLLIDNRNSTYKSASQAYNHEGIKASGDYLMFVHQDVLLLSRNWLKEAEEWLSTLSHVGMAGVAGMLKPRFVSQFEICSRFYLLRKLDKINLWYHRYGRGNLFHGSERQRLHWHGKNISNVEQVQTVDDLLMIIPATVFDSTKFDELACDYWHLYGVDFGLTVSKSGFKIYVLPCSVVHHSIGNVSKFFLDNLRKVTRKHRQEKIISTTYGLFPTRQELINLFWVPNSIMGSPFLE